MNLPITQIYGSLDEILNKQGQCVTVLLHANTTCSLMWHIKWWKSQILPYSWCQEEMKLINSCSVHKH